MLNKEEVLSSVKMCGSHASESEIYVSCRLRAGRQKDQSDKNKRNELEIHANVNPIG